MSEADSATQQTTEDTQAASAELQRIEQAQVLIQQYMLGAMGAGLVPLPLVDIPLVSGVQLKMLHALATLYEQEFQKDLVKPIIGALLGSVVPASATSSLVKFLPGFGSVAGAMSMSAFSGASTYALGKVFIQHFESGGTFLTFDPDSVRDYFSEALEEGKKVAESLRKTEASAEPMKQ